MFPSHLQIEKNKHHAEMTEKTKELDTMRQTSSDLTQKLDSALAKAATLTTLQTNFDRLQHEKTLMTQNLTNEQMKVEMLRNTLAVVYGTQRQVVDINTKMQL